MDINDYVPYIAIHFFPIGINLNYNIIVSIFCLDSSIYLLMLYLVYVLSVNLF